ncbi:MAG: hypothetical protein WEB06_21745 [Actinomycetota bacterium]
MNSLETRYRRLLALYPRDHRAAHEEEMIGVLLAVAKPGQRWPGIRDTADVLRGALLIRLRRARPERLGREWSDALAIVSVLASVLMCVGLGSFAGGFLVLNVIEHSGSWNSVYVVLGVVVLAWPAVLFLALVGLRRTSVTAAWVVAVLGALGAGEMQEWAGLGLLAALALTWSPGPARGVALLGRSRVIAYLVGAAALVAVFAYGVSDDVELRPSWITAREAWVAFCLGVLLVARVAFRFNTAWARRVSLLLALPLTAIVVAIFRNSNLWSPQQLGDVTFGNHSLLHLIETSTQIAVPVAVLLAIVIFNRRAKRRIETIPDAHDGSRPAGPSASPAT